MLAAEGRALPGLPRYDYDPLRGDAHGFYWAARGFLAAIGAVPAPLLALALLALAGSAGASLLIARADHGRRWLALVLPAAAVSLAAALVISEMSPPGAGVIGWSLLWAAGMAPYRALAGVPTPDAGYAIALPLSLLSVAVTTVATAYIGLYATGRRWVALGAAGLFTVWPLLVGPLTGEGAWENGQWHAEVGLALYTEPVSTALVAASLALLLRPGLGPTGLALSGLLVGFSTAVKLTNGLLAAVFLVAAAGRFGPRGAVPFAAAGVVSAPILAAYWPKGYVGMFGGQISASGDPFALVHADDTWLRSPYFTPTLLLLLAPLLVAGCLTLPRPYALVLVLAPIAVTAAVYSFYDVTRIHPRFLYVALPSLFVLEAAGAGRLVDAIRGGGLRAAVLRR